MKVAQVLIVFIGCFGICCGVLDTVTWIGKNTNWDSLYNWRANLSPGLTSVCRTVYADNSHNIVSSLSNKTYNLGYILTLPLNGKIILKESTILKFKENPAMDCANDTIAAFTGGTYYDQGNDFACHKNWQVPANAAPPCDDYFVFPGGSTYAPFLPANVSLTFAYQIKYGSLVATTETDIINKLGPQFYGISPQFTNGRLSMDNIAFSEYKKTHQSNGVVYCFDSCPTDQVAVIQSQLALAGLNVPITKKFSGFFLPASLGTTSSALGSVTNGVSNWQDSINEALQTTFNGSDITVTVTLANTTINVVGQLTAAGSYFVYPGTSNINPADSTFAYVSANTPDPDNVAATIHVALAQAVLASIVDLGAQAQSNVNQNVDAGAALNSLLNNYNNPLAAFNAAFPPILATNLANCANDANTCFSNIVNALQTTSSLSAVPNANITDVASNLANAANVLSTDPSLLTNFINSLTAAQNAYSQNTFVQKQTPQPVLKTSPVFTLGKYRSAADLQALIAPANLPYLKAFFYQSTFNKPSTYYVQSIDQNSMTFTAKSLTGSRRRRDSSLVVLMTFNYTINCVVNATSCGIPVPTNNPNDFSTMTFNTIEGRFDLLMQVVPITVTTTTTTAAPVTTTASRGSGTGASSSEGGSSGGIGIIAAAAGGGAALVIIVVLIILYKRKQKQPSTVARADDRTVVAFENPMYDDPHHQSAVPVYDNHQNDHEGLYDEPAFQQQKKNNPLYQSAEGLNDQPGNQGGDGYLDVSAQEQGGQDNYQAIEDFDQVNDTGYLDQQPVVDDAGYLDQQPQQ